MGHSICGRHGARTCDRCDRCPKCHGFRMTIKRCPVGWCGEYHLCPTCAKIPLEHDSCRKYSAQHEAWNVQRKAYYAQGIPVRCSAMGVDVLQPCGDTMVKVKMVHVLFADSDNPGRKMVGYYMHHSTYDAYPLVEPRTPDDYRKVGLITQAPSEYVWEKAA